MHLIPLLKRQSFVLLKEDFFGKLAQDEETRVYRPRGVLLPKWISVVVENKFKSINIIEPQATKATNTSVVQRESWMEDCLRNQQDHTPSWSLIIPMETGESALSLIG